MGYPQALLRKRKCRPRTHRRTSNRPELALNRNSCKLRRNADHLLDGWSPWGTLVLLTISPPLAPLSFLHRVQQSRTLPQYTSPSTRDGLTSTTARLPFVLSYSFLRRSLPSYPILASYVLSCQASLLGSGT